MEKMDDHYSVMLERLRLLEQSIHILNLVNNDLRQILHKHKALPKFIQDSFKRVLINKSKGQLPIQAPPPTEREEIRLAVSVIDKAKRAIENVSEKKPKQISSVAVPIPATNQPSNTQNNRVKSSSTTSVRLSSAVSNVPPPSDASASQQVVRRFVPAHMKAPFQTQAEKKRRPSSSTRNHGPPNSNPITNTARRTASQQRRATSTSVAQPIVEPPQMTKPLSPVPLIQKEDVPTSADDNNQENIIENQISTIVTYEHPVDILCDDVDMDLSPVPEPIILNRALIKPLHRIWKQNQTLRIRLEHEREKKQPSLPSFISRLNEQIHSQTMINKIRIPSIDVLIQLAIKLRSLVLFLLENATFDDLGGALRRLNTLKYLVSQYKHFYESNLNILVLKHRQRSLNLNLNIDDLLKSSKQSKSNQNLVRYTDDGQLIAFTEVRFKQFENECRWIELNWHEQMIKQFKQTLSSENQNSLGIYRELMSLVTGLQTSTPIVVENRFE